MASRLTFSDCNSVCRTCLYAEDFSTYTDDYCTSCDLNKAPFLHLLDSKPTCVQLVPANAVLVAVRNNKILGVLNEASNYGSQSADGTRTTQADGDQVLDRYNNQRAVDPAT